MTRFRRRRKTVVVSFAEHEADILANLLRNLIELLYDGMPPRATESADPLAALLDNDGPTAPPEDVVLQRLLPNAYSGDDMAAAEFRRFTERGLRAGKAADAKRVLTALENHPDDGIPLEPDDQLAWLRAINDLRLAIGTRLDIKEEDDYAVWEKLPDDDPRRLTYDLYDWLGYLQSALLHNMR
ncbi:hypothetical protein Kfla_1837 [Kribbella flavida DSM 17836]|uniref:Uncharacterized protein n=1 Tax=Kribbella flavida (strain DSM 17836 / JCM 10339 / NBRC 14399) TaxID=479435 RepID=D2PPG9_KRIFD|nr:DUF2017 domain-containing protein [Kribbella flavida]ADB30931.1 hypothetical protein Kfla_1837 [Kribbella flavida DSM 17836]